VYDFVVADHRNPSGRRPPILPLPPPPDSDEVPVQVPPQPPSHDHRRPPPGNAAADLPRLPEVGVRDESNEVRVDPRALSPGRDSLSGARALPVPPPHPRTLKQTAQQKPQRAGTASRALGTTPRPPPRSAYIRVETAQHSSLIGERYQILSRIGQGGMGKVYKVRHIHLSRTFALKIISNQVAETDEARELFYREARFASAMAHPNITTVVDFGEDEKVGMFMVMELVDGEALNRVLFRDKQLSVRKACDIVLQLAEALHYIHKQGVVHCDIKTENILISEQEQEGKRNKTIIKLLDFGLARSLTASRASTSLSGTPHYVAPERIRGEPASPASDVYGVGILLYELVTGQVPWDGAVQQILAGHLDEQPKSPQHLVEGGIDPALETLIMHALAKHPSERHKDMAAFIYELKTVMDMMGFGRRVRQGPAKRVVIEQRSQNGRDELARIAFDGCRLPLALVTPQGVIVTANPAFTRFVMGASVEVEGLTVQATPLASAWATAEHDLARTLAGSPVRRIIEVDVAAGEARRLLLWLDAVSHEHIVLGVQPLEL
jgi:tRNA A-37 threonylcarbamoyl transferase component Bud32